MHPKEIRIILISTGVAALIVAFLVWAHLAFGNQPTMDYQEDLHQRTVQQILILETGARHIPCNYSPGCTEVGIAQFKPETWRYFQRKFNSYHLDINNPTDQVTMLSTALRAGLGSHWSTFQKAQQRAITSKYLPRRPSN